MRLVVLIVADRPSRGPVACRVFQIWVGIFVTKLLRSSSPKCLTSCEIMISYILILTVDCLFTKVLRLLFTQQVSFCNNLRKPIKPLVGIPIPDFLPSQQKPGKAEHVLLQFLVLDLTMSRACLAPYQKSTLSQNPAGKWHKWTRETAY
jgi:hypothetical protein